MICLSQFPEVRQGDYDFIKTVSDRRPPYNSNIKVGYWTSDSKDCININLYDIQSIIEANTNKVRQSDTYAILMERDRFFAINISAYPPKNYFLFDIDILNSNRDPRAKLDYISMASGFFPLPKTFLMKIYLLNQNEEYCTFFMENNKLITEDEENY